MTAGRLLILAPLAYLGVFFLYPLVAILDRSLGGEADYGLGPFRTLLGDSYYLGRIWFTIWQALVSTLLTGGEADYGLGPFRTLLGDSYYLGRIWFTIWQALVSTLLTGGEADYGLGPFRTLLGDSYYLGRIWFTIWQALVSTLLTGGEADYGLGPFRTLLGDSYYLGRIWFTIWQALVSTLLTLAVGLPAAYLFARYEFPGKTLLKAVTTLPFVMPTIVVAMGFVALFGSQGIINAVLMDLFGLDDPPVRITNSLTIIFMAHAFYNYAIIVRIVSALWANLDPYLEQSAQVLGAGRIRTFYHVTLPLLRPAIVSSSLLAFAFSFTSFGVVLILGGPQFATLEVAIYELTAKLFRLPLAGALAVIQMVFTFLFLLLYSRFEEHTAVRVDLKPREATLRRAIRPRDKVLVLGMVLVLLAMLSPLIALVVRSITFEGGYGTAQIANLFSNESGSYFHLSPLKIIWNSLRVALATVAISLVIGTIVAYFLANSRRQQRIVADALFMLPLGVSAVTLGFGYIIALGRLPLDIRGSWVILVIAHSLVAYPFVIRSLLPVLKGMSPNLREAAAVLGAPPARVFLLIDLPIVAPALLVGATFAFAVSMGEFGASLLLVRPEFTTLPIAIFRFLGLPGAANLGQALTMSTLLMAVVALGFVAIERFRYKGVGGF